MIYQPDTPKTRAQRLLHLATITKTRRRHGDDERRDTDRARDGTGKRHADGVYDTRAA